MRTTVFVTGNPKKAEYFSKLIGITFDNQALELDEIQSTDMKKISKHKAEQAYNIIKRPIIVEDTGLFFTALSGLPGPFVKFFIDTPNGLENLCRMLDGFGDRTAYTMVEYCYYDGNRYKFFSGRATGTISDKPRGEGNYGYGTILCIDGYDGRTLAELSEAEYHEVYLATRPLEEMHEFFKEKHG